MFVFDSSSCKLILEEDSWQNQHQPEDEIEMNMYRQLQVNNNPSLTHQGCIFVHSNNISEAEFSSFTPA